MLSGLLPGCVLLIQLLGQLPVLGNGASIVPSIRLSEVELEEAVHKVLLSILQVVLQRGDLGCLFALLGLDLRSLSSESVDLLLLLVASASCLSRLELSLNPQLTFLPELPLDLVQLIPWEVGQLPLHSIEEPFSDQLVPDVNGLSL